MGHDATITQSYIDNALRRFIGFDAVRRNHRAFIYLRGWRRRGDEPWLHVLQIGPVPNDPNAPLDVNLADAEHYLYARYLGSVTGDPSVKALVAGYQLKKFVDSMLGTEQAMRTNANYPVLPPSMAAVESGLRGAEDGLIEYRSAHGGKSGKIGSAFQQNQEFIAGNYTRFGYK